jgi:hypothetical protein
VHQIIDKVLALSFAKSVPISPSSGAQCTHALLGHVQTLASPLLCVAGESQEHTPLSRRRQLLDEINQLSIRN